MPFRALLTLAVPTAVLALVLGLAPAAPASAHDVLASTVPVADSTVDGALDRVSLTFSEPPLSGLETGIVVSVTTTGGTEVGHGDVRVDGSTVRRAADLTAAGPYTVTWRSVSVDGHPVSGSYRFTSTGAPASPATTTPSPGPTAADSAAPTTAAAAPTATAAAVGRGPGATPWVLGGVAVLVTAGLVAVLLLVRRRTDHDGHADPTG
ncbi:copper resistance CopC family protein [Curtobacterium pusillum]|uniref:copper resistance CopC family protein n=1 Tax=Curtobacterium pusillum TaxID=69373 RepID=UPI0011A34F44|nr:copper resistance CopC family protein [Curtobacterium pusillum]